MDGKVKVYIVYDTSFLMDDVTIYNGQPDQFHPLHLASYPSEAFIKMPVLPTAVKQEIAAYLNSSDPATVECARRARVSYANLLKYPRFQEVDLNGIAVPPMQETVLGPDTDTGKRIIGLIAKYVAEDPQCLVYVATKDGGVIAEIEARRRANQNERVFSPVSRPEFIEALAVIAQRDFENRVRSSERFFKTLYPE